MALMYLISGPGVDRYPEIGLFSIEDHENGKIYVHRPVDRETTPSFTVPKIRYCQSLAGIVYVVALSELCVGLWEVDVLLCISENFKSVHGTQR